jgi:hypothetical protein
MTAMDPLQAGITAARQGRRADARAWLQEAIRRDADNEPAWLWLSTVVETDAEYRLCLTRALAINPNNETTRARLADLASAAVPTRVPIEPLVPLQDAATDGPVTESPRPAISEALATVSPGVPPPAVESPQVRRIPPHLVAAEPTPPTPPLAVPEAESSLPKTALPALAVMGCLAVTAVSGLLVLLGLLVLGWAS